jgi:hypothetical protein
MASPGHPHRPLGVKRFRHGAAVYGLFTLFSQDALQIKKSLRKAQQATDSAAGVSPRPGLATPRMALLATPLSHLEK